MRKHKILALALTLIMTVSLVLAGCGKKTETPAQGGETQQPTEQTGDKLDADQTLRIIGYDFKSLDTAAESDAETFTTFNQVFEGLAREQDDHKIVLAGAESMDVSDDGLVYTFHLRKDAKWSDGKPVTAKDYEFGWKRLINPDNAFDYMQFLYMIKNVPEYQDKKAKIEDVGIKAVDDYTFQVTLSTKTPFFPNMLSFNGLAPQREDVFNTLGKDYGQAWDKLVYNGPFTIADYQKGSKIVYKKNPNYWDAKNVKLETAECTITSEVATLVQMFQAKQQDQVTASGDFIAQLNSGASAGGYENIHINDASSYYIIFNFNTPLLKSLKIRQALSAAFDRQGLLDTVYKSNIVALGFLPPGLFVGDKEFRKEVPDEPTKKLLDEVKDPKALFIEGLKELNMDPDPSKAKLKLLMGQATSTTTAYAQYLQNQFETKIGVKVEIQHAVDSPAYFQARTKGEFDLCAGGWGADFNDVSNFMDIFVSKNGNNNGKYNSPTYDDLIAKAAAETDTAKRVEMYKEAEDLLLYKDCAIISTYYRDRQIFRYTWAKGIELPLFGGYYSLRNAYIQGRE